MKRPRSLAHLSLLLGIAVVLACCGTSPAASPDTAPTQAGIVPTEQLPTDGPQTSEGPMRLPQLQVGAVGQLYYTDSTRVLTLANIAGFRWFRQQIVWRDIEGPNPGEYAWGELDEIVQNVAAHNLKLLVSIVRSPNYSGPGYNPSGGIPDDPSAFGNFVAAMAQRYGNTIAAYEIWNEMNLAVENGGTVTIDDAGTYVELLMEAYKRIKALQPGAYVIAGPPAATGVNDPQVAVPDAAYYRAIYGYKNGIITSYFDAQAVHPGGAANPPDTLYPSDPGSAQGWNNDPTFYFRYVENVRQFMVEEGVGDHQIWITEFGWATQNDTSGYEFGNQTSFQQQADYIIGAIKWAADNYHDEQGRPWVGAMFLWNLNFAVIRGGQGDPLNEQASYGILNPDWSTRPAFTALQGYLPQLQMAAQP